MMGVEGCTVRREAKVKCTVALQDGMIQLWPSPVTPQEDRPLLLSTYGQACPSPSSIAAEQRSSLHTELVLASIMDYQPRRARGGTVPKYFDYIIGYLLGVR